jgi:FixJ family two-component response regulator
MSGATPIVLVVDDDPSMREALSSLVRSAGLRVETYGSAQELLGRGRPDGPACLVLDMRLPRISGLDLQERLAETGIAIPIICITAHGDIPMTVRAMKAGAAEFLTKPFQDQDLLDAIRQALERDSAARDRRAELEQLRQRLDSLTPREHQVMGHVVAGALNKQIALELGISEVTVKLHRAHVMQKMHAESLADLVRIAARLGVPPPR